MFSSAHVTARAKDYISPSTKIRLCIFLFLFRSLFNAPSLSYRKRLVDIMMYSDLGSPSYTSAMMSIRPQHDPYRSLPVTPVGMDPRNIGSMDVAAAMNHARMGLEAQDYFSSSPRFAGNMRPSSPYPLAYEGESSYTSGPSMSADLNLSALINRYLSTFQPATNGLQNTTPKYTLIP